MMDRTARFYHGVGGVAMAALVLGGTARAQAGAEGAAPLEVEVSGVVEAPLAAVREVLLDLEGFAAWFPALGEWRVLSRDERSARVYGRQQLPWPVADRDYVVRYRWWEAEGGAFVLEAVADPTDAPPPRAGVVRLERVRSEWRLEPDGERTRARYRYRGHPGGSLPEWVARVGWRAHTGRVLEGLADEVARRR